MRGSLLNKQEKSLVAFNLVEVRIMTRMSLRKIRIRENRQVQLLDLEANMEVLEVKILLNLDIIMRINLDQMDVMTLIQKVKRLIPVKLKKKRVKTKNLQLKQLKVS